VTYRQAVADAKQLAATLIAAAGSREVAHFRYAAIPRGGLIVLGMLSYALDLGWDALLSQHSDAPLVVVDDCALSGARFGRFLRSVDSERIVFAHLYSHPDLRAALVSQEPRVVASLAAHDLRDLARERYPDADDYVAWRDRWHKRLSGPRYWIGQPELVIFPWTEPDHPVWNPVIEQVDDNWRLAAPDRCLKNWSRLGLPPSMEVRSTFRSPDDVAFNVSEGSLFLCDLRTEQVYGLEGVGADVWRALAAYGDLDATVAYLLDRYDVDEARLRSDLSVFLEMLLAKGLLERVDEPGNTEL
jgi:hypothetical protein